MSVRMIAKVERRLSEGMVVTSVPAVNDRDYPLDKPFLVPRDGRFTFKVWSDGTATVHSVYRMA